MMIIFKPLFKILDSTYTVGNFRPTKPRTTRKPKTTQRPKTTRRPRTTRRPTPTRRPRTTTTRRPRTTRPTKGSRRRPKGPRRSNVRKPRKQVMVFGPSWYAAWMFIVHPLKKEAQSSMEMAKSGVFLFAPLHATDFYKSGFFVDFRLFCLSHHLD